MKSKFFSIFVFLLLNQISFAQNLILEFPLDQKRTEIGNYQQTLDLTGYSFQDFIALSIRIEGDDLIPDDIRIQVQSKDSVYFLHQFHDEIPEGKFVSELVYLPVSDMGIIKFTFDYEPGIDADKLTGMIRFFSPGGEKFETPKSKKKSGVRDYLDCNCPMPDFVPRSSWGSSLGLNGNIYIPPATYTDVSHMIVHHSAGTNTSSNWSGVVASIFDFHVNTNGWQDVGYNWLIDPNGIIYEGRGGGDNVRGAHMCGYNNNTMGVCILGTYSNTSPTQQSIDGIKSLLAWKSCLEDIDPVGSSQITSYPGFMKHISGHKDGCAPNYTECPGNILYSLLDSIRNSTKYLTDDVCISSSSSADTDEIFKIFPNPTNGKIFLEFESENKFKVIKIFDFTGKLILNVDIKNEKHLELDLSSFAPGYFIVKLIGQENIITKRFIRT